MNSVSTNPFDDDEDDEVAEMTNSTLEIAKVEKSLKSPNRKKKRRAPPPPPGQKQMVRDFNYLIIF